MIVYSQSFYLKNTTNPSLKQQIFLSTSQILPTALNTNDNSSDDDDMIRFIAVMHVLASKTT